MPEQTKTTEKLDVRSNAEIDALIERAGRRMMDKSEFIRACAIIAGPTIVADLEAGTYTRGKLYKVSSVQRGGSKAGGLLGSSKASRS